mmetsp:Transcript_34861/g.86521  ORF Transcript_34861/g.86521 Transcript_34861/m.86521 type:complete len:248 (+) Transcript_34861:1450-2193(+)
MYLSGMAAVWPGTSSLLRGPVVDRGAVVSRLQRGGCVWQAASSHLPHATLGLDLGCLGVAVRRLGRVVGEVVQLLQLHQGSRGGLKLDHVVHSFDTKQYNCHANGGKGDGYHRYGEGQLIRLVHYLQPHCHKDKRNTGDECPHSRFPGPIRVSQECDDGKAAISYEAGAAVLQPRQDQNRETVHAGGCQEGASVQSEEVLGVPCGLIQTDQRIQPIPTEHRGGQGYRSITVKAEAHTRAHLVSCDES